MPSPTIPPQNESIARENNEQPQTWYREVKALLESLDLPLKISQRLAEDGHIQLIITELSAKDAIKEQAGDASFSSDFDSVHTFLDLPIESLGLSTRVQNALIRTGMVTPRLLLEFDPESLLQNVSHLGKKELAEIEQCLANHGWLLSTHPPSQQSHLMRWLVMAFVAKHYPSALTEFSLAELTQCVIRHSGFFWSETKIASLADNHPYLTKTGQNSYKFQIRTAHSNPASQNFPSALPTKALPEPVPHVRQLVDLWQAWLNILKPQEKKILLLRYRVFDDEACTLKQAGEQLQLSRERIRQIEHNALEQLGAPSQRQYWDPLRQLLQEAMKQYGGLMTVAEWEIFLEENSRWESDEDPPQLLYLLCAILREYTLVEGGYQVATYGHLKASHFNVLHRLCKRILKPHKERGLPLEVLLGELQAQLPPEIPDEMRQSVFLRAALRLFGLFGEDESEPVRPIARQRKASRYPEKASWMGQEGSELYQWERKLRTQLEKVAWVGQLVVTEADFAELGGLMRQESSGPNLQTGAIEGNPRRVPAAVFITTMVFAARYAEPTEEESIDEFWSPYLRAVWQVEYTQAFMARCRKRYKEILPYLEQEFGLIFPRYSDGDVVTPIFRHALVPRYMQTDFAQWLRKNWHKVLEQADTPTLLAEYLRQDVSLGYYYPHRLKHFMQDKRTADTAVALLANMAAAISLHINDGESIENIAHLLSDTPIEKELWEEIAQEFKLADEPVSASEDALSTPTSIATVASTRPPRLSWLWDVDGQEMVLRGQNWFMTANSQTNGAGESLQGRPTVVVWLENADDDLFSAAIQEEVNPVYTNNGQWVVREFFLTEPDGSQTGQLVLLTDYDEEVGRVEIPPLPCANKVQFFRLSQQGAYGVPVSPTQVSDGLWYLCATEPVTLLDEDDEEIVPAEEMAVPYPLGEAFGWAAQFQLTLPVTVRKDGKKWLKIEQSSVPTMGRPTLQSSDAIAGLSRQIPPLFASNQIVLRIDYGGEWLLKQATLWVESSEERVQRTLVDLRETGLARMQGEALQIDLSGILPADRANIYTIQLRQSLQPIFPVPLELAIVPNLIVEESPTAVGQLYTPAHPPHVTLSGISADALVSQKGMDIHQIADGRVTVTWQDLRHEPRLTLRLHGGKVDIPLGWPLQRLMTWLEPEPANPFLTLVEAQETKLHAVGSKAAINQFDLCLDGKVVQTINLKQGRVQFRIGSDRLYDLLRRADSPEPVAIVVQVAGQKWPLFTLRQRPELAHIKAEYDLAEETLMVSTGVGEVWLGDVRFVVESLSNPFTTAVVVGQEKALQDVYLLPCTLPEGEYHLQLELDDMPLSPTAGETRFWVGDKAESETSPELVKEIREGGLISPQLAEDFVFWWAELAEKGESELSPATLYQLATIPAHVLQNFMPKHLTPLWTTLADLREVHNQQEWIAEHGLLPAWVLHNYPFTVKTERGVPLKVFPIQTANYGRSGKGYARWRLSLAEEAPKTAVLVEWRRTKNGIRLMAGVPDSVPNGDWSLVDLLDTHNLKYCSRCGRLTSQEYQEEHRHGRETAELLAICTPVQYGGYEMLVDVLPERRGIPLLHTYEEFSVPLPPAESHYPPPPTSDDNMLEEEQLRPLHRLERAILRVGAGYEESWPLLAGADRLLRQWYKNTAVSELERYAFALGVLLRTAAHTNKRRLFHNLCHEASLTTTDLTHLIAQFNQDAPKQLAWGLVWAELIILHSEKRS